MPFATLTFLMVSLAPTDSHASLVFSIYQSGSDLVVDWGAGSLNLSGLTPNATTDINSGFASGSLQGVFTGDGATAVNYDFYTVGFTLTGSIYDGAGASIVGPNSLSGPAAFGVRDLAVFVPAGYVSGGAIAAGTMTFANTTFADADILPGSSATWTWGGDSITVQTSAVPEVGSITVLGLCLGFGIFIRRRR